MNEKREEGEADRRSLRYDYSSDRRPDQAAQLTSSGKY